MRLIALLAALLACACGRQPPTEADVAAVYEAFLHDLAFRTSERVLLQEMTVPVHVQMVADWRDGRRSGEVSRELSPEVREALRDLIDRSVTPRPLGRDVRVTHSDVRLSPDSVEAIFAATRRTSARRLPEDATVVQLSTVGFSQDGTVAAVYENQVCGNLCGGASVRIVRRHPAGWLVAEQVVSVVY
jgi:hypothetical protein